VNTERTGCQLTKPNGNPTLTPPPTPSPTNTLTGPPTTSPTGASPTPPPTHGDCAPSYYIFTVDGVIQGCKKCPPGTYSGFTSYSCSKCPEFYRVNEEQTGCVNAGIPIPPPTGPPVVSPAGASPTPPPTLPPTILPSLSPSPSTLPSGNPSA
jgi:hypothetical protein